MDLNEIRNAIRSLRKSAGITQKDIAVRLFMDERTYSKIERGEKKSMDVRLLASIADALNTDIATLLRHSSNKKDATPDTAGKNSDVTVTETHGSAFLLQQNQIKMIEEIKTIAAKLNQVISTNHRLLELLKAANDQDYNL